MKAFKKYPPFILLLLFTVNSYAQEWQFAHSFGGQSDSNHKNNKPQCMEVDNEGNTYVFGTYGALTELNDSILPFHYDGNMGSFIVKFDCNGDVVWHKAIANSLYSRDQAHDMVLKDNYLYITGNYSVVFGNNWWIDTLVYIHGESPNEYPWDRHDSNYIIKMDLDGNIIEHHRLNFNRGETDPPPTNNNRLPTVWCFSKNILGVDNDGNIYTFAQYNTTFWYYILQLDNEVVSDTILRGMGGELLLKMDSNFNLLWYKPMVESWTGDSIKTHSFDFNDMCFDSDNNAYLVGSLHINSEEADTTQTELSLGNGQSLTTYGKDDFNAIGFLLKMNSEGVVQWTQQTRQFYSEVLRYSPANFKNLVLNENTNKIYVGGDAEAFNKDFIQPFNDGYVGDSTGTIFGENDTLFKNGEYGGGITGFIAEYDLDGNYYNHRTPNTSYSSISSIDLNEGKLYATVRWSMELEHQDSIYENNIANGYGLTICVWDTFGNPTSSINIPSTCFWSNSHRTLEPFDVRVNNRKEISLSGIYHRSLIFGEDTIDTGGNTNTIFVAKYGKACPTILEEEGNFCYGDAYRDTTLLQSGTYQFSVVTPNADSVITLNATVHPPLTTGLTDTVANVNETLYLECTNQDYDSYQWSTGSNTYYENLSFSNIGMETVTISLTDGECSAVDTILIDVGTSNIEALEKETLYLYPNPAKKVVYIKNASTNVSVVEVCDITGKTIKTIDLNKTQSINIDDLKKGVYFVKAGRFVRKLVKQ